MYTETQLVAAVASMEQRAVWYAWGRTDNGAPAIVTGDGETRPSQTTTVFRFGTLYSEMYREFFTEVRHHAPGIVTAWETFVASNGERVI